VNNYCTVTFRDFFQNEHGTVETSVYEVLCMAQMGDITMQGPLTLKVVRDLTSDVYSYEGGDARRYIIDGGDFSAAQVVRLAAPLSLFESRIVDSMRVNQLRHFYGPQGWANLLSMQGPLSNTSPRKYTHGKDPSLSLDASDWINVEPSETDAPAPRGVPNV
jgi:hypothetical protein